VGQRAPPHRAGITTALGTLAFARSQISLMVGHSCRNMWVMPITSVCGSMGSTIASGAGCVDHRDLVVRVAQHRRDVRQADRRNGAIGAEVGAQLEHRWADERDVNAPMLKSRRFHNGQPPLVENLPATPRPWSENHTPGRGFIDFTAVRTERSR
jgi:hypothetical protein